MISMIDTHCHIFNEYYDNIDEVINNMDGFMIVAGTDDKTNLEVIDLVNKYEKVYGVIGIQPEEINKIAPDSFNIIEQNIDNPKIVGIGEIGLDYYWDDSNKDYQKEVFCKMMDLASKYHKPVIIHSRESIKDTYDIICKYPDVKCVLHCYSSSLEMAKELVKKGVRLGIGGVLTFKNAKKLIDVVKEIPLEYLLLETDSPFLTPEPYRGKQNSPKNVLYVAEKIAEIKGISTEQVLKVTTENAIEQFDLPIHV